MHSLLLDELDKEYWRAKYREGRLTHVDDYEQTNSPGDMMGKR